MFQNYTTNLTFFENEESLTLDDKLNFGIVFNDSCDFETKVVLQMIRILLQHELIYDNFSNNLQWFFNIVLFFISYVIKYVLMARIFRQRLKNPTMVWVADTQKKFFLTQMIIIQSKYVIQLSTFLLDFWGFNTYWIITGSRRRTVI